MVTDRGERPKGEELSHLVVIPLVWPVVLVVLVVGQCLGRLSGWSIGRRLFFFFFFFSFSFGLISMGGVWLLGILLVIMVHGCPLPSWWMVHPGFFFFFFFCLVPGFFFFFFFGLVPMGVLLLLGVLLLFVVVVVHRCLLRPLWWSVVHPGSSSLCLISMGWVVLILGILNVMVAYHRCLLLLSWLWSVHHVLGLSSFCLIIAYHCPSLSGWNILSMGQVGFHADVVWFNRSTHRPRVYYDRAARLLGFSSLVHEEALFVVVAGRCCR